jgi:hypothetical protein
MAANDKGGANSKKAPTKSEIYAQIVDDTGLSKKDVAAVFDSLSAQIKKSLAGRNGSGLFTLPGLLKMRWSDPHLPRMTKKAGASPGFF